jgi:glutamine amidotransferase PdxT
VDALERKEGGGVCYTNVRLHRDVNSTNFEEEKKEVNLIHEQINIDLPGASDETNAREVICAVRKDNILCTAFHPEIADDLRWHSYFVGLVMESKQGKHN